MRRTSSRRCACERPSSHEARSANAGPSHRFSARSKTTAARAGSPVAANVLPRRTSDSNWVTSTVRGSTTSRYPVGVVSIAVGADSSPHATHRRLHLLVPGRRKRITPHRVGQLVGTHRAADEQHQSGEDRPLTGAQVAVAVDPSRSEHLDAAHPRDDPGCPDPGQGAGYRTDTGRGPSGYPRRRPSVACTPPTSEQSRHRRRRQHLIEVQLDEDDPQPPETPVRRPVRVPGGLLLAAAVAATAIGLVVGSVDRTPADATTGCPGSAVCVVGPGAAAHAVRASGRGTRRRSLPHASQRGRRDRRTCARTSRARARRSRAGTYSRRNASTGTAPSTTTPVSGSPKSERMAPCRGARRVDLWTR